MPKPLPFRDVALLMLRNTRRYSPIEPDLGERLGLNQRAAVAIAYAGQVAGGLTMVGAIPLLLEPLLSVPTFGSESLFIAAMPCAFVLGQSLISYVIYRAWLRHWQAKA
jgi:hypothetical protein